MRSARRLPQDSYTSPLCPTCLYRCQSEKPKKEYSFNPSRIPSFISPPFSAPTPPGSAPGSAGLCHFHLTKARRRGAAWRGDGRPHQRFSQRRQTRVPAARPFGASANPTHPGNKSGRGAAGRSQLSPRAPPPSPPRPPVPRARARARWAAAASCVARLQASSAATVPAKFSGRRVLIAGANGAGRCRGPRSPGARDGEGGEGRGSRKATYTTSLEMIHDTMAGGRAGAAGAARHGSARLRAERAAAALRQRLSAHGRRRHQTERARRPARRSRVSAAAARSGGGGGGGPSPPGLGGPAAIGR